MKRVVNLFLFAVISCYAYASGINKMYVQRNAGNECVFFIFSQKIPALDNTKMHTRNLEYDFTYAQRTDSVSMLLTVVLKEPVKMQQISIVNDNLSVSSAPETIYVKSVGSKMKYRLRLMMPFEEFYQIYNSPNPYTLMLSTENQGKILELMFGYDSKKWVDNSKKMRAIIELIKLNTGKK